jgi:hypothetical protein
LLAFRGLRGPGTARLAILNKPSMEGVGTELGTGSCGDPLTAIGTLAKCAKCDCLDPGVQSTPGATVNNDKI